MRISVAHLLINGMNSAIFDARPRIDTASERDALLAQLTRRARFLGLRVDQSALAYMQGRDLYFWGTPSLVSALERNGGVSHWTHTLTA